MFDHPSNPHLTAWNPGIALFHDLDGSLIDIAAHPAAVWISPKLPALLEAVQDELGGAFAVVSGRRITELDQLLAPLQFAGAGVHGAELRRTAGGPTIADGGVCLQTLADALRRHFINDPRILVEDKGLSVALHYRLAAERQLECAAVMHDLARRAGLVVQAGKCVFDAMSPGIDKGHAVRYFMGAAPFLGRVPVFVGDDLTDEHGIAAAQALGGYGVKVGTAPSVARFRLPDVAAVHRWLASGLPEHAPVSLRNPAGAC